MNIIKSIKNLKKYEIVIWVISILSILISFFLFENKNYYTLVASLIGVTALIFVAKGDVLGQILTVAFSTFYGYISFEFKYYGELITYMGMTAPIALISIITWLRNPYSDKEVKVANLNKIKILFLTVTSLLITIAFYFILKYFNTKNLIVSTISILTSYLAVSLTMFRSKYYALAYALNDVILIILWVLASIEEISYIPMVVNFIMFLVNDIYGYINWNIMQKRQKKTSH